MAPDETDKNARVQLSAPTLLVTIASVQAAEDECYSGNSDVQATGGVFEYSFN